MRIELLIIFGVLIVVLAVIFCIKVAKKLVGRVIVIIVAICVFMGGGSIINLNCLANEAKDKVQQVVSVVGDSYIKTEGSKIFINIDMGFCVVYNYKQQGKEFYGKKVASAP